MTTMVTIMGITRMRIDGALMVLAEHRGQSPLKSNTGL
jgi:hypothetical protein